MNYEERLVCESGILWRRVMKRFEEQVNKWLEQGFVINGQGIIEDHFIRVSLRVVLQRAKKAN